MAIQPFAMQGQVANIMLPSEAIQGAAQAKAAQNRNAMFEMDVADRQAAAESDAKLNALFQQSGGDMSKMREGATDYRTASMLDKQIGEQDKLKGQADKARLQAGLEKLNYGSQLLQGATPENWQQIRQEFGQMTGQDLGEQFDPAKVGALMQQGLAMKDKLANEWKQKGYELDVAKFGEQQRHNITQEGISQQNANNYGGGGESGGKPKNQIIYDAQGQGYVIDVNDPSLTPRPIGMGGAPTGSGESSQAGGFKKAINSGQPTDAERTAGYLLEQARLGSKQMGEALAEDPSAANKPFSESIAERLPFVNDEDINAQRSPERQRFTAAAASFAEAALRAATGAGMNIVEEEKKIAELTPRYGESDASIKDKLARQEMYLRGLEVKAGRAAPKAQAGLSGADAKAMQWARSNPNDPRSSAIIQRLGGR